ncbi:MAG: Fur family transcriptional regulator [Dethiobacteria bacterium]|jgi:Fur family peroxide stress response transcriptional regulator
MQSIEEILRAKKIKVTPQRMAVYSVLKNTKSHPSVENIYQQLKPDYPAMSLATVYKTVDVFKKVGLIQELSIGDGGLRYDADMKPHSHIYCRGCGRIVDLQQNCFAGYFNGKILLKKINEETGFDISSFQLYFYGLCPRCKKAKSYSTTLE